MLQESIKHKTKKIDNKINYIRHLIQQGHEDIIYRNLVENTELFYYLDRKIAVYLESTKAIHLDQLTEEEIDAFLHYPLNWQHMVLLIVCFSE